MTSLSRKGIWIVFGLSVLAVITWGFLEFLIANREGVYGTQRVVRYGFSVENRSAELVQSAVIDAFLPLSKTPFQRLDSLEVSAPYTVSKSELGNEKIRIELAPIPPYGNQQIIITAKVSLASVANEFDEWAEDERFLRAEKFIESDSPEVSAITNQLSANETTSLAKRSHDWASDNIVNAGYVSRDLGAVYALKHLKGDCTEYTYTVSALSRSVGIPAVPVAGFQLDAQNAVLRSSDYHNWAYLRDDDKWVVSDPMNKVFGERADQYVAFNVLSAAPKDSNSQRFYRADSRLNVRML